jgi:hypothetical protein
MKKPHPLVRDGVVRFEPKSPATCVARGAPMTGD